MKAVLERCRLLLPPPVREIHPLPYLAPALDAGMATLFAEELIEAMKYLNQPQFYTQTEDPSEHNIWLGAADDVILRKRGVEFVDGTAPGSLPFWGRPLIKISLSTLPANCSRRICTYSCLRKTKARPSPINSWMPA